ncbi:dethiobiotin synthase [Sulfurimonas sp.]|uniref:dethiobiotin synthase n=1 Tax=Sulfurimonas sp. TaxID=2022749 RepID=UPI0025E2AEB0|nr:dethiobiotin synthase [Sulfurimonas sp.]MBT5934941.1 dethiobiotin synthase [Sulfurimonas sp.]
MAKRIFVTATNTDIGKTYTTKLLLKEYASRGLKVGVIKPIETGVIDNVYPDGDMLLSLVKKLNPAFKNLNVQDIVPISYSLPAAPFVASNAKKLNINKIITAIEDLEKLCDVLIIEGAGGLYVPLDEEYMLIDLIKELNAATLLVTHCSLGCINDTRLSQNALETNTVKYITAFNCKKEDEGFATISEPYYIKTKQKVYKTASDIDTICDVLYNL